MARTPYFRPNKLGLGLKAAGKRVPELAPTYGTWMHRYEDAFGVLQRKACEACRKQTEALAHNAQLEQDERDFAAGKERHHLSRMRWEGLRDAYLDASSHLVSQAPLRSVLRRWFDPAFSGRPIASITIADCVSVLASARKAGLQPSSVRQLHLRGHAVFAFAVEVLQELTANPWATVPRPEVPHKDVIYLRREQVNALLLAAGRYRLLLLMAVFTGARRGELAGLKWTDVDFSAGRHGVIHFRRSWAHATTKGKRTRPVPIHPMMREELLAAAKRAKGELVFPSPRGGGMRNESWHTAKLLRSIAAQAGVELPEGTTFHALRRTFGTHLVQKTGDLVAAQRLSGHTDPRITERAYVGTDLEHLEGAIEALDFGGEHIPDTTSGQPGEDGRRKNGKGQ